MLTFRIALRYLFSKKSHSAVNIISLVSMAGVAVAAMAMICVMSVFNGFTDVASSRLSAIDPEVRITRADGRAISDADSLAGVIDRMECVADALPVVSGQALAVSGNVQMPVMVTGVPAGYDRVSGIGATVIDGEFRQPDHLGSYSMLSAGVAVELGLRPGYGSVLKLTVPRRTVKVNPALPVSAFRTDTLIVSGVYQSNQAEYDMDRLFVSLDDARRLFDYQHEATSVDVALKAGADADVAVAEISAAVGPGYTVANRMAQQAVSFRMIEVEKWVTFLMMTFILVMASFNILSTMSMLIIEKRQSISILYALGATRSTIRRIFLNQGFLIAAVGGVIGLVIGMALVEAQSIFGFISLGGDHSIMSIDAYPVRLEALDVAAVAAIVAVIGLVSGLISAIGINTKPVATT